MLAEITAIPNKIVPSENDMLRSFSLPRRLYKIKQGRVSSTATFIKVWSPSGFIQPIFRAKAPDAIMA